MRVGYRPTLAEQDGREENVAAVQPLGLPQIAISNRLNAGERRR
jgi:hypothetical protein